MSTNEEAAFEKIMEKMTWKPESENEREIVNKIILNSLAGKPCEFSNNKYHSIAATFFRQLFTSRLFALKVDQLGIRIINLTIKDELDLDSIEITFPLIFENCTFKERLILRDVKTRYLSFEGCKCGYINASRITVNGSLWMNHNFTARGIELNDAIISGNLSFAEARIYPITDNRSKKCGKSVILDRAKIGGKLCLWEANQKRNFISIGEFSIKGGSIGGNFTCREAKFIASEEKTATGANGIYNSLVASLADIKGVLDLREVESKGQMLLMNMTVHGDLRCDGGNFTHQFTLREKDGDQYQHAISLDRSTINGSAFLCNGFRVTGQVRMFGIKIMNDLDCSGGSFLLPNFAKQKYTLFIVRSHIDGDILLRTNKEDVDKHQFLTNGIVYINSTTVNANINIRNGARFIDSTHGNEWKNGLQIFNCRVTSAIRWIDNIDYGEVNKNTVIKLNGTKCFIFEHDFNKYKINKDKKGENYPIINMEGFVYERLNDGLDEKEIACQKLPDWTELINKDQTVRAGVYQHLAFILMNQERYDQAQNIFITTEKKNFYFRIHEVRVAMMQLDKQKLTLGKPQPFFSYCFKKIFFKTKITILIFFSHILERVISYGYRPLNSIKIAVLFILLGASIFWICEDKYIVINPTQLSKNERTYNDTRDKEDLPEGYPYFHPFIFSLETFFPVGNLGIQDYWVIRQNCTFLLIYSWVHKVIGWIISLLAVAGLTTKFARQQSLSN